MDPKLRPPPPRCDSAYHDAVASTPLLWDIEFGDADLPVLDSGDRFLQVGRCSLCGARILRSVEIGLKIRK